MYAAFLEWLRSNGAEFSRLEILELEGGQRGVRSREPISSDERIVKVPKSCILTSQRAFTELPLCREFWNFLSDKLKDADSTDEQEDFSCPPKLMALVLHMLLTYDDPANFFFPYYQTLPISVTHFPIFWKGHELAHLTGSDIIERIQRRKMEFESDFRILSSFPKLKSAFVEKKIRIEEFNRIRSLVGSRNFNCNINSQKNSCMVPFADLLNHKRPRETKWTFDNTLNVFSIRSLIDFPVGVEVNDSYGAKPNKDMLLYYGFVVEGNNDDSGLCRDKVTVSECIEFEESDWNVESKRNAAQNITGEQVDPDMAVGLFDLSKQTDIGMKKLLRFLALKFWNENDTKSDARASALAELGNICRERLKGYADTEEGFRKKLVEDESLSDNEKAAIRYILSELTIFSFWALAASSAHKAICETENNELEDRLQTLLDQATAFGSDIEHFRSFLCYLTVWLRLD